MSTLSQSRADLLLPAQQRASENWLGSVQLLVRTAGLGWSGRHFAQVVQAPQKFQEKLLRRLVTQNASTHYGTAHNFRTIRSLANFQARVPIVHYETVKPWIAQIADGASRVLTRDAVLALRQSGGCHGTPKLVPVTQGLLESTAAALRPWLHDWLHHSPHLGRQSIYWELPPARKLSGRSRGQVPYASTSPGPWVGGLFGDALEQRLAVLPAVSGMSADRWRRSTLYSLLMADDLGAMVLGNPGNMLDLFLHLEEDLPDLLERVPQARADAIRRGLDQQGRVNAAALWPRLKGVTVWQDGPAAPLAQALAERFPGVRLRSSPMQTQEAYLTVPLWDVQRGAPLAVTSHFFEFLDVQDLRRPPILAHALRVGAVYQPIVSTAGGLYRYQLEDVVRCVGHYGQTPVLEYVEKSAPQSNMCGERLTPQRVQQALEHAVHSLGLRYRFALCAPLPRPQRGYCMYMDTELPDAMMAQLADTLEEALCCDYGYWYCRQHGQLDGLRMIRVRDAWQRYRRAMQDFDLEHWHIKPSVLDRRAIWPMVFL